MEIRKNRNPAVIVVDLYRLVVSRFRKGADIHRTLRGVIPVEAVFLKPGNRLFRGRRYYLDVFFVLQIENVVIDRHDHFIGSFADPVQGSLQLGCILILSGITTLCNQMHPVNKAPSGMAGYLTRI